MTLFIGGPADGHEIEIQGLPDMYRVVVPASKFWTTDWEAGTADFPYRRVRMGNRDTQQVRSVFAPVNMDPREVEHRLTDHLLSAWVNAAPDERKAT